jgi:putative ABC transport system ATP-binding protein
MIRINELTKVFRNNDIETRALNNINLDIIEGEFIAIMGPSGCGKSTLLNILGLLDFPTNGNYFLLGQNVTKLSEKHRILIRKNNIGFIFQSFNLIDELTVYENIELPLLYLRIPFKIRKFKVEDILDKMNLTNKKKFFPQQLSGGQQQMVAVSRAIITQPKLLLADEPTGNLDSTNGMEIIKTLQKLNNEGTTIIMVTHAVVEAEKAHRVIQILDGQILLEKIKRKNIKEIILK